MDSPFPDDPTRPFEAVIAAAGGVFAEFRQQDSGCLSFGLAGPNGMRWFVKHGHRPDQVASLERAVRFHRAVRHPAIVPLRHTFTTADGLALVYPWRDGEILYGAASARGSAARTDPASAHARFRAQPVDDVLAALDDIVDAHIAVEAAGFVAVDLYDGCLLYDFSAHRVALIDLDEYRPGSFVVTTDRLPGSTRFMPPEHRRRGASVDHRSTVFLLGRAALVLLDEGDAAGRWRGPPQLERVAARAAAADPTDRYPSVAAFAAAWRAHRPRP